MLRIFNHRFGIIADLDAPSERYELPLLDGAATGKSTKEIWDEVRDTVRKAGGFMSRAASKALPGLLTIEWINF